MPTPPDVELLNGSLPDIVAPVPAEEPESDSDSSCAVSDSERVVKPETAAEPIESGNVSTFHVRTLTNDIATFKVWAVGSDPRGHEIHIWNEGQPLTLNLDSLRNVMDDIEESIEDVNKVVEQAVDSLEAYQEARNNEFREFGNKVLFGMMIFFFFTTFTAIWSEMYRSTK